MSVEDRDTPKLFFVVSAAMGELFNAMYLLMGCGFRSAFALRQAAFELNQALPGKCYSYENASDLLTAIEAEKPDMVCLFSGYLIIDEKIMDVATLDDFVNHLLSSGIKVITSDPFLGLQSRVPTFDPHNPFEQVLSLPFTLAGGLLFGEAFLYFSGMPNLKRLPHVYVVDPDEPGDVQRLGFFNPYIRHYAMELEHSANGRTNGIPGRHPHWMFILGIGEYRSGIKTYGVEGFHNLLAHKLRETLTAGRQPVLLAPKICIDALSADASLSGCLFIHGVDYQRYMSLLIRAEYAFYWNIFSASILARLINFRPTFFLGNGHVASFTPQMFEKGMRRYYQNASLTYLQEIEVLSESKLAGLAAAQEDQLFRPVMQSLRDLPQPKAIIHQLLQN